MSNQVTVLFIRFEMHTSIVSTSGIVLPLSLDLLAIDAATVVAVLL